MFIAGIAGMENTAVTAASVIGEPSGCRTVTSIVLSPDFGGSGSLRKSIVTPSVEDRRRRAAGFVLSLLWPRGWPGPQPPINMDTTRPIPTVTPTRVITIALH